MSDKKYTSINRDKSAGRVEFQDGKTVWHWSQEEQNESTSMLLKSLENPDLELEKTQRTPVARRPESKQAKGAAKDRGKSEAPAKKSRDADDDNPWGLPKNRGGGGFDPYNRG